MSEKDELNNGLDNFLQVAYGRTVAVSHNNNCTFHSMGRNVLEMYLENKKSGIKNGLGERIIKKLIKKHVNKLENPVWAHAGWHPLGSFAYRKKSFLESVKYYFSNATWGWFNIINPLFWLSELIWGEYANDFYRVNNENQNNEIELPITQNLSEKEKYRIGNILGQLIREEIADVMEKSEDKNNPNIDLTESNIDGFGGFVEINIENHNDDETEQLKTTKKTESKTPYKNKMVQSLKDMYPHSPGKFSAPYVTQNSKSIILEWQYLTSNDFLEDKDSENQNNNSPAKAIILEVNQYPISFTSAKIVLINNEQLETLRFDDNKADIKKNFGNLQNDNQNTLICVIGKGYFIGRCQPIVSSENKKIFIEQLLNTINIPGSNPENEVEVSPVQSMDNSISNSNKLI